MPNSSDLLTKLRSVQAAEYEAELADAEAREQELRANTPDAHHDGPQLFGPISTFDPSWQEQQDYADQIRAADPSCDARDYNNETPLSRALFEWRQKIATHRWQAVADQFVNAPACAVCGGNSSRQSIVINAVTVFTCSRCRPSMMSALSEVVSAEMMPGGLSRRQTAENLVRGILSEQED